MQPDQASKSWFSQVAWIVLILAVSLAIADALLAPAPAPEQPDFIDTVLASRAVVVSIRIAVVFAALFLVLSVAALIIRRQWLARVGPVEVEKVVALDVDSEDLEGRMKDANQAIEALEERVAHTHQLIDREAK
ncbi:MAG: hypothetical protein M3Y75_05260 [Actinomycetota bacterium]|nr:hypothetical protein [Actinomycetota bacterium]